MNSHSWLSPQNFYPSVFQIFFLQLIFIILFFAWPPKMISNTFGELGVKTMICMAHCPHESLYLVYVHQKIYSKCFKQISEENKYWQPLTFDFSLSSWWIRISYCPYETFVHLFFRYFLCLKLFLNLFLDPIQMIWKLVEITK